MGRQVKKSLVSLREAMRKKGDGWVLSESLRKGKSRFYLRYSRQSGPLSLEVFQKTKG